MIYPFKNIHPSLGKNVFIAESASIVGDVFLDDEANIWFGAVLRGDTGPIKIGKRTNIQDNSVLHVRHGNVCSLGNDVTVGHNAIIHNATVKDRVLVGMGAIIMDDVVIEPDAMIAAGAFVSPGTVIPSGTLALGFPAKVKRDLTKEELAFLKESAMNYVKLACAYLVKE